MKDRHIDQFTEEIPLSDLEASKTPLNQKKILSFDDMLPHSGDFGCYQWLLLFSLIPYTFTYGVLYFAQLFITLTPPEHWCHIDELEGLTMEEKINNKHIPASPEYPFYDTCHRWNNSWANESDNLIDCSTWDYNLTMIPYVSLASELDWVCDRSYYVSAAQSIFFAGSIVGGFVFGWLADHRGRIPALVICNGIALLATIATSHADAFWNFALIRFFAGLAFDNCINIPLIIVMEYMAVDKRSLVVNGSFGLFFAIATTILPWAAYYIADWRIFSYVTAIPLLSAIITPWILPESARWYLSSGMTDKVVEKLKRIAKFNKKNPNPAIYDTFVRDLKTNADRQQSATLLALRKTPRLAKHMLIVTAYWSLTALAFDGHVYSLKLLQSSVFVSFTLSSATEFPAGLVLTMTLDRCGRRCSAIVPSILTALCSILLLFITTGVGALILAVTARFMLNMAANVALQFAAELLPTPVRAQGVSFIHIFGIIAHCVAPYIIELAKVWEKLPMITLAIVSILATILVLFLPETSGEDLPQTLQEGENFGKGQKMWSMPCCGKKANRS
ncbi:carcinine transporter-like [Athalia rosae]|uniref:carcinine transporter-like n=1 Tax=Athalia rosae TaxID=37344 RepID=UPI0020347836|nr:carcinine transporter-like [Athalia rosae]XP_012268093.2 carcinine transporter-like [Athalia rosae]XP_020711753.2 carcinine transporter-like [Athalia rosae]